MASSREVIVNQALGLLNVDPIVAFTDGTTEADLANSGYDDLRDAVLEDADWSFAIARAELSAGAAPDFGFANAFDLESGTIRVISVNGDSGRSRQFSESQRWKKVGNTIETDYGEAKCVYIAQITDTALFSAGFTQALVYRLAWTWAIPLTKSRTMRDTYREDYGILVNNAQMLDGQQGTPENVGRGRLINARVGQGRGYLGPTV